MAKLNNILLFWQWRGNGNFEIRKKDEGIGKIAKFQERNQYCRRIFILYISNLIFEGSTGGKISFSLFEVAIRQMVF